MNENLGENTILKISEPFKKGQVTTKESRENHVTCVDAGLVHKHSCSKTQAYEF